MTITLTETPKIKYSETSTDPTVGGDGAEIPVIMGITGNSTPASGILTFRNYSAACKTVANGGIGTDTSTNPLLAFLKKFFEENVQKESSDLVVPYVYVIDLGTGRTTTGSGNEAVTTLTTATFTTAFANAKIKRDATAEVLVGFEKDDTAAQIIPLIDSALAAIAADAVRGSPRILYFSVDGMTMDELKALTNATNAKYVQDSRCALVGLYNEFGKTCARIFTTHYSEEPGYAPYRSVAPNTFIERTSTVEDAIQNAGIIFNHDEKPAKNIYPKINLAVSTSFAKASDNRPNDCLLHARRNVDQLIRDAFEVIYPQLKRNETEVNLSYLQADLDHLVNEKILAGYMMEGTQMFVEESASNPIELQVIGVAVPVNATEIINFELYIKPPNTTLGA